ncbi:MULTISPECIES: hypothetical protein [unclassified Burkholderia]|uniref:DUF6900 domain-containing protein n=1 Tax=unclassified Burkholderia TaxID=2613784 RepID=UPI000759096A|nr:MULTISPECIES: hypothetical protein [unclassified Burkholderia]KVN20729.1 hypothetical protein WT08_28510 [Burkholderia sp. MSMB1552]KWZ47011.1 hypothetical protein WS92_30210 [Burkholderia sp. MSMB1588]
MTKDELEALLERIAFEHLGLDTLETRHRDSLDFHDCSVWSIRDALIAAFEAGVVHGRWLAISTN